METESIKLEVHVTAWSEAPSLGIFSTLLINQNREIEEFIIDKNDDSVTSFRSYPDSSSPHDPLIYLRLENFEPDHVYQVVRSQLQDHILVELISNQIVVKAQQLRSQSFDLPQEPLFMVVSVKLTQKEYIVVPCNSDLSTTDLDQESEEEWETTCAICLEDMSGGTEDSYKIHNCSHWFHEKCLLEWYNRNNSCPLCRQPVDEEP